MRDGDRLPTLLTELRAGSDGRVPLSAAAAIDTTFALLGVENLSPATRARFEAWYTSANTSSTGWSIRGSALMLGLLSPDFQLS